MPTPWYDYKKGHQYPALQGKARAEIAIIGGGLCGIWTAYLLAQNHEVILLEADELGAGATIDTTAFITEIIDTDAPKLAKLFGAETARQVYKSGRRAIGMIAEAIRDGDIDCDFSWSTAYVFAAEMDQYGMIEQEYERLAELGVDAAMHTTHDLEFVNFGHYEVANQAKYHPLKFLRGLAGAAVERGAQIYEGSEVELIEGERKPFTVRTDGAEIDAERVIIATYNPFNKPHEIFAKKGMYKSYCLEAELPAGRLMPGLYWDKHSPYNYFRIDSEHGFDRLILGGQDQRYELPVDRQERFRLLEDYLKKLLPETGYKILKQWAGPILEPSDGLPLIGQYRDNLMLAAGFSGNGMTYSPIAATVFRDIIESRPNDWVRIFNPDRLLKPGRLYEKGQDYAEELWNGVIRNFFRP
ncbi:MAG: NAD(P)/FAD-dependent oxidoreductase [Candidatus Saccharibacteria bacterium]